jgi:two-component system NarL family response regulator
MATKIILADDHRMVREGLNALLERESDMEVVAEASDGRMLIEMAQALAPDVDVIVLDIGMPNLNGIEATRRIIADKLATKVIILSAHTDKRYVLTALEAGAHGYVVKDAAGDELIRAIRSVMQGRKYLSPEVANHVVDSVFNKSTEGEFSSAFLGSREREVLQLLSEGKSSPQIAATLHISVSTVEAHRRNIMKKLDLHSVAELTKYAVREGLTTL